MKLPLLLLHGGKLTQLCQRVDQYLPALARRATTTVNPFGHRHRERSQTRFAQVIRVASQIHLDTIENAHSQSSGAGRTTRGRRKDLSHVVSRLHRMCIGPRYLPGSSGL